jgi:hypothetical protein
MSDLTILEDLQSFWSDYYKDYYGFRPRFSTSDNLNSVEWLKEQIADIDNQVLLRKQTFEGRESLREEGWIIKETDPELVKRAELLQKFRDMILE